jgi:alpha,alpha-trehalase
VQASRPSDPFQIYGELFLAVQRGGIFADQKTFVDCVPKLAPALINEHFAALRQSGAAGNLREFVAEHFLVPEVYPVQAHAAHTLRDHLEYAWSLLRREPDALKEGSSLLPLAQPYIIPGGRFREIYYWDSYFTMLGLRESGQDDLVRSMTDNFADLIARYGLIPNANRSYCLTRSQPPVFALMVELVAVKEGPSAYQRYLPALQAELDYWNDRDSPARHVVELPDGSRLQRYFDQEEIPRLEAYAVDEAFGRGDPGERAAFFRHLRSAAESGWDFSSRWFVGGDALGDTRTAEFIPVDLNCFLVQLERTLSQACVAAGDQARADELQRAATTRIAALQRHCWSPADGWYFDFHAPGNRCSPHRTLAAVTPLFLRFATPEQAAAVAHNLQESFLRPGGLVTTLTASGEQWDAPNGWAPLQWMAIAGLRAYGHEELAAEIARRWIRLNASVFEHTGRLMEKYNVVDLTRLAGGGEYPTQDGFGWTNGVLLKLLHAYPDVV